MQACLAAEDPGARAVPYLMSGGTDAQGLAPRRHPVFRFRAAPAAARAGLRQHVPRCRRAGADRLAGIRRPRAGSVPRSGVSGLSAHYAGRAMALESRRVRGGAGPAGPPPVAPARFASCSPSMPSTAAGSSPGCAAIETAPATSGSAARSFACAAAVMTPPSDLRRRRVSWPACSVRSAGHIVESRGDLGRKAFDLRLPGPEPADRRYGRRATAR